jgi:hypothetical protein
MTESKCKSCQAPIIWAVSGGSGKHVPIDPEPQRIGTVLLREVAEGKPPVAHVTTSEERDRMRFENSMVDEPLLLHVSHFATCPDAAHHRRR